MTKIKRSKELKVSHIGASKPISGIFPNAPPPMGQAKDIVLDATPLAPPTVIDPQQVGIHNSDLEASRARVINLGSWKKQDIVLLLPTGKSVPARCALSWMNLIYPPNNGVARILVQDTEVGQAYSASIEMLLNHPQLSQYKFILTVEHDNMPPQDGVLRLVSQMEMHPEFAAISGLYWTKGPGGAAQIWGDINDPTMNFRPQPPRLDGGLMECYGIGMGFALWRMDMFKDPKLRRPWFKTVGSAAEGVGTQDLYFANDARQHGYRFAVDCGCLVGHFEPSTDIVW